MLNTAFLHTNHCTQRSRCCLEEAEKCQYGARLPGSQGGKVTILQGTPEKHPGDGAARCWHSLLAPGAQQDPHAVLCIPLCPTQAGYSLSVPECKQQSAFKTLTYTILFLEKKT